MEEKRHSRTPVRVSLPASVAADIGRLRKAVGTVLDKLGCPNCCSGIDIHWELQRDVVLTKGLTDRVQIGPKMAVAMETRADRTVHVSVAPEAVSQIEEVYVAIDRIAEISGHPACATGCDMFFNLERTLVLDANLAIEEQVMRIG